VRCRAVTHDAECRLQRHVHGVAGQQPHLCEILEAAFTAGAIVLLLALSSLSLGGFGPAFWALLIGMAVSLLLEQSELRSLRADA
jgi:hypothetical protein